MKSGPWLGAQSSFPGPGTRLEKSLGLTALLDGNERALASGNWLRQALPPGERAPRERVFVSRGNVHLFGNFRAGNERELHSGNPGNGRRYAGRSQASMGTTIPETSGCSFPGETCTCSVISGRKRARAPFWKPG